MRAQWQERESARSERLDCEGVLDGYNEMHTLQRRRGLLDLKFQMATIRIDYLGQVNTQAALVGSEVRWWVSSISIPSMRYPQPTTLLSSPTPALSPPQPLPSKMRRRRRQRAVSSSHCMLPWQRQKSRRRCTRTD